MNKKRREKLTSASVLLLRAHDIVSSVLEEEQDAMYNTPDNLQGSDAYSQKETSCYAMEDVVSDIQEAVSKIESARDSIDEAMYP